MKKRQARKFGYARVSRKDQKLALQLDALKAAKCNRIFSDHGVSGSRKRRPALDKVLTALQPGDTLVTWKVDRLGRRARHLLELRDRFEERGIDYQSLTEGIDIVTPEGELLFLIMAAVAQHDLRRLGQRTKAGMAAARARGVKLGRPLSLTGRQLADAKRQLAGRKTTLAEIAGNYGIAPITLRRALKREAEPRSGKRSRGLGRRAA